MKARLLGLVLPSGVVGAILGGTWFASKLGFIPPLVWHYLWPALIAFGFLLLSVGALVIGARRWLWPCLAGFVVQSLGLLLLWADVFEAAWEPLIYTLVAVGFVLFVMLVLWLVATLRARWLEEKMLCGVGGAGTDQQKIAEIRKNMLDALRLLKRAGRGRNAIYELPWFLVIGRSQAGKTVAIKNSGLGLPVRKDWVKGVGGTHTCDWFFTNDLIFLDTPGAWVTEGAGEEGQKNWVELLRLLRKYRGRRPLDGLVVLVPADDLLSKSDQELQEQASNVRQVIDLLHDELKFRFPVYLLVSKCDLVEGFVDFFKGIPAQRRNEILGWSHGEPNEGDPIRLIPLGFRRVVQRLQAYRLEMLARIASTRQARRLFFFSEEFKNLERPLIAFAGVLFEADQFHEAPVFRGFYFTSGTQGEGSPLGQAMAQLARALGVRVGQPQAGGEEEPKRSYFLLELFRNLMVGDQGLVSRTAIHWWKWRRDTMFVAFLPAGLASIGVIMSFFSFLLNSGTYRQIRSDVPGMVRQLRTDYGSDRELTGESVIQALHLTDRIRSYHKKMTGFTLLRGFGMRRPGDLADRTFEIFREQFNQSVLRPTLEAAERYATDPENTCTDRADVLYSVVWLRQGRKEEWSDDLKGLGKVWNAANQEQADEARARLRQQFAYAKGHGSSEESLLPGFSMIKVAESLKEGCSAKGAGSSLEQYRKFQKECGSPVTSCEVTQCWRAALPRTLKHQKEDYAKLRSHFEGLREDLQDLRGEEPEAVKALELVKKIPMPNPEANECLIEFNRKIVPAIERYVDQDSMVEDCRKEWQRSGGKRTVVAEVVKKQGQDLEGQGKKLFDVMQEYNSTCEDALPGSFSLDANTLFLLATSYRLTACMGRDTMDCVQPARKEKSGPRPPVDGVEPPPRPRGVPVIRPSDLSLFTPARQVSQSYTTQGWESKKQEWDDDVNFAKSLPPGQQAQELALIRQQVDVYAQGYYRAWKGYLEALRLKERKGAVSGWLRTLADSSEFGKLLRPAAQAVPSESANTDPPFDVLSQRMESLRSLGPFVGGLLGEYLSRLGQIAQDLDECEKNSGFLGHYRSQIAARDPGNKLVEARNWVELRGGAGLAEGALKDLLLQPLGEAEEFVRSPDLTMKQWGDLVKIYAGVSARFPFAGQDSEEMADLKDLTALLGGQSGLVPVLLDAAKSQNLSPGASTWLDRASTLSRALFDEVKDEPRPVRIKVTVGEPVFEPPQIKENFQIDKIQIYLGEGSDFPWKEGEPRTKSIAARLLGEEASTYSFVAVAVAERKGALGRTFGSNFKEAELKEIRVEGLWAPVRLLEKGLPQGLDDTEGKTLSLVYVVEVPYKKNQPGKLKVPIRVEGVGLAPLLHLAKNGLAAPPPSMTGE